MDGKCPEKANRGGREREKEREMEGEIQRERPRVRGRWGDSRGERKRLKKRPPPHLLLVEFPRGPESESESGVT